MFGASQPAAQPTSIFGAPQSTFGSAQPTQTTGMFGAPLGAATQGGTTVKFEAVSAQGKLFVFFFLLKRILFLHRYNAYKKQHISDN